jgi:Ser/Thr protein kinase RdoA (MazF antagonist)
MSSIATTALSSTTESSSSTTTANTNTNNNKVGAIGSKLTDLELAKEALSKYFDDVDNIRLTQTTGGVNNVVQYVDLPNGQRELLRIYNNGCDYQRVKFEHAILEQLNDNDKIQMSFRVPKFLQAKRGTTEDMATVVRLSNGADACMCELIPGTLPKLTCARDLGRAAGELNTALTQVSVDRSLCNVAPYYDMWGVHHAVTQEEFIETMRSNLFDETRDAADVTRNTRYC